MVSHFWLLASGFRFRLPLLFSAHCLLPTAYCPSLTRSVLISTVFALNNAMGGIYAGI